MCIYNAQIYRWVSILLLFGLSSYHIPFVLLSSHILSILYSRAFYTKYTLVPRVCLCVRRDETADRSLVVSGNSFRQRLVPRFANARDSRLIGPTGYPRARLLEYNIYFI